MGCSCGFSEWWSEGNGATENHFMPYDLFCEMNGSEGEETGLRLGCGFAYAVHMSPCCPLCCDFC